MAASLQQLTPGQPIGEYLLEARIGHGATGEVWRAHHHVWNDRKVAIKIPTNPDFLRSIKQEGLVHEDLSRLESPHLVKMLGLNVLSSPPFMVMEYIEGQDLRRRLEAGKLKLPETLRIVEGVLKGLEVAHQAGIIHRDIKPENILLDVHGAPKLTDFSIAVRAPTTESLRMSLETDPEGAASLAGTLVYMSPEQRAGGKVDRRSDMYSMGLLLFEMLTAELPQPGDRVKDFVRDIPEEIDELFARCFTRYERRFSDASAMLLAVQDLRKPKAQRQGVLSETDVQRVKDRYEPSSTKTSPTKKNVTPPVRTRRRQTLSTRDLSLRDVAKVDEKKRKTPALSTRELRSRPETEKKTESVEQSKSATSKKTEGPRPLRAEDITKLINDLPDDKESKPDEIRDPRPSRAYDEVLPSLTALYRHHNTSKGMSLYAAGKFSQAEEEFRKLASHSPNDPAIKKGLAMSLMKRGRYKDALSVYREIVQGGWESAEVWNNVGVISMRLSKLKDAEAAFLRAIELRPRYASAHANLGSVCKRLGRSDEAKRHWGVALEIDPSNFEASYNLGIE